MAAGGLLFGTALSLAQAPSDALRNISDDRSGTARVQAMGGKAAAIGADPGAMLTNPAGSALYYRSALSFSFDVNGNYYFPYIDQKQQQPAGSSWTGGFSNASYVSGSLSRLTSGTGWNINWGLQYNKDYDYARSYEINFEMPATTIGDFIAYRADAAGAPWEDYIFEEGVYDPIMEPGLDPIVTMGMNSGIIEYDGLLGRFQPGAWAWSGAPEVSDMVFLLPDVSNLQVSESGSKHSFDINLSAGYDSRFFFGASFRMTSSKYGRSSYYSEEFYYQPKDNVINITYDNDLSVSGRSYGLNLGALFAVGDYGRVGLSYLLPQYASYDELYYASAGTFNDAIIGDPNMGYNTGDDMANSYSMWLPGKLTLSAMAFLGNWGMVTYDFSWQNLASATMSTGNGAALEEPNFLIGEYFGHRIGNHLGLEVRPLSWLSLRAGGSYTSSGVKLPSNAAVLSEEYAASGTILDYALPRGEYSGSAGVGLTLGSFTADLAYVYRVQKNEVYPYPASPDYDFPAEGAYMDISRHSIIGTLTMNF